MDTRPPVGERRDAEPDLAVSVGALRLRNPVCVAAGCFHYGRELAHLLPLHELGAVCTKGTAQYPWTGNPGVRIAETACGFVSSIGLENPGIEHYVREDAAWLRARGATIIVNVVSHTLEEYLRVAERLTPRTADAIELNLSCPNIKEGGAAFGVHPEQTFHVMQAVRQITGLPLFVKLTPNVASIAEVALAAERAGADGITVINNPLAMAIDVRRRRPALGTVFGGLAGPAIKPIALRVVWEVASAVHIPVIGVGGIMTADDALEFIMAGASAIQLGSAVLKNPLAPLEVIAGIRQYLRDHAVEHLAELIGCARRTLAQDTVRTV